MDTVFLKFPLSLGEYLYTKVYQKFMYKMFCYEIYSLMYNYL